MNGWEARHRARRLALAIRDHEIAAVERAAFYAIVGAPDSPPTDSVPQPSESESTDD